jgi:TatD family-associated radical SAM protein
MEEIKNKTEQSQNQQGGGRKRRRRHRGGHGGNNQAQNQNAQNVQNAQNNQNGQNGQKPQKGQAPQNQNQGKQGGQNNAVKGNGQPQKGQQNSQAAQKQPQQQGQQGGKKNKNKQPQQSQNQQVQQKQNQQAQQKQKQVKQEENRKDTYLYTLDGNLYVNLTNKCSNGCDFCVRNERTSYYGNYLWLRNGDPTVEKVIAAANGFGDLTRFKEVVFCGFGEPTYKVAEMTALCDFFHEKGLKTRLNTNGQGNLINKRDITPELKGKIDFVNVSLNASCVEKYQPICRSQFGEAGFAGLVEFAKLCRRNGIACRFSIVDCIGEAEVEACKRLAQSVNVPLYVREYITDS